MLHDAERDEVIADVAEEYAERRRASAWRARVWLWRQVVLSVPGVARRSWHAGTTGFESDANRLRSGGLGMESWIMDARFALRRLRSRMQYGVLSVLTLALGIGGTTAVFGVARAILLEPLPYANTDELVTFWSAWDWREAEMVSMRPDWPGFAGVAAYTAEGAILQREGAPPRMLSAIATSSELFDVLGVRPLMGRGFRAGDDEVGAEPTAVLSHGLWQELGARTDIVGSLLELDGTSRRVIGVMPAGFWFPDPSWRVWLSTPMRPDNNVGRYVLIGRLEPGRSIVGMTDPLNRIASRLGEQFTYNAQWDKTAAPELTPLRDDLLGPVRPALLATLAGMGVILLMACANVATLMLGQLRGRTSELAVRTALGAGRRRVAQQLLVEAGVIGLVAGVLGALTALAGFRMIRAAIPLGELADVAHADWTLFLTALVIALFASMLIAMVPVFSLWRGDLRDALSAARTGGINRHGGRLEDLLVIGEVAMAVLLAASAAVLIRSVDNLRAIDTGIDPGGVGVVDVMASGEVPGDVRRQQLSEMVAQLAQIPGVQSAGLVQRLPLRDRGDNWGIQIPSKPELEPSTTALRVVSHDYFEALGIEVVSGRVFDGTDRADGELVTVIDEALADKYFPGEDPLGQLIHVSGDTLYKRIIGVVGSVSVAGLTAAPEPTRYVLYEQFGYTPEAFSLVVRTGRGADLASVLQRAVGSVEGGFATFAVRDATTMNDVLNVAMGPTRRIMQLMTLLGALALTLGAVGVYGVVSHFVNRRRRDWMIRMALGEKPLGVLRQVVGRGAALVTVGCATGVIAALALTRLLSSLLYGVSAADPLALVVAAATLISAGCIAALIPAARASRTDPAAVLREG